MRGVSFRSILIGVVAMIALAIWIHFHSVLVPNPAILAENSPPAGAVGVFLGVLIIGGIVGRFRKRVCLTVTELVVIYAMLVTSAPFMTQGMWHRFLGLLTAIPMNRDNYSLVDSFSERLWPHGPHLVENRRFADAPDGDTMRVVPDGSGQVISVEASPIGPVRALELTGRGDTVTGEVAEFRIRLNRMDGTRELLTPGERYFMHALVRLEDMAAGAYLQIDLASDGRDEVQITTIQRDTPVSYSAPGGFTRRGSPEVLMPRDLTDTAELVFRLHGRGRAAITDITFFSNEALARLYGGSLEVRASDLERLALNERDATLVRPDRLLSVAGVWYVLKGYVPWGQWAGPLFYWVVIIMAIVLCLLGIAVIFRRQWEDNERFSFPLVVLPRLLLEQKDEGGKLVRPLFRKRTFRIGVLVAFLICLLQGLAFYVPGTPDPTVSVELTQFFASPPVKAFVAGFYQMRFELSLLFLSIAFFIDLEMLMSIQLFFWLSKVPFFFGEKFGWKNIRGPVQNFPFAQEQHIGAFLGLALMVFWVSRKHLWLVGRRILGDRGAVDDSREMFSYRVAALMILLSFVVFALWGRATGLGAGSALVFFGFLVVCGLSAARIRTEVGAPMTYFTPYFPYLIFFLLGGLAVFGPQTLVLAFFAGGFMAVAQFLMFAPTQVEMMHLANQLDVEQKRLGWGLILGVLGGVFFGGYVMLVWAYGVGAQNIDHMRNWAVINQNWYFGTLRSAVAEADNAVRSGLVGAEGLQPTFQTAPLLATGFGFAMTLLLTFLRARFVGFWLHPIGYVLSNTYFIYMCWGSLLLALIIKSIALRIGGPRLIRQHMTPFFAGIFCGAIAGMVFWDTIGVVLLNQGALRVFTNFP